MYYFDRGSGVPVVKKLFFCFLSWLLVFCCWLLVHGTCNGGSAEEVLCVQVSCHIFLYITANSLLLPPPPLQCPLVLWKLLRRS